MFEGKKKYDFYIGGPMRGYKELNEHMFTNATRFLRAKGLTVWSPSEHSSYLKLSFAQCMMADLNAVINQCRKIALLPGWRDSLGANIEAFSAFACHKEAVEIVPNDNTDFDIVPIILSEYRLPYQTGETRQFNPHGCQLDSFIENDVND